MSKVSDVSPRSVDCTMFARLEADLASTGATEAVVIMGVTAVMTEFAVSPTATTRALAATTVLLPTSVTAASLPSGNPAFVPKVFAEIIMVKQWLFERLGTSSLRCCGGFVEASKVVR